jgi:hypothetical protein
LFLVTLYSARFEGGFVQNIRQELPKFVKQGVSRPFRHVAGLSKPGYFFIFARSCRTAFSEAQLAEVRRTINRQLKT